ncbi:MAG: hypothetical protein JWN49_311 [Parcubacteria group bacterium]|nr:hypothetical protein [Parcubacteria group bacterium]
MRARISVASSLLDKEFIMIKKNLAVPLAAFALVISAGGGLVAAAHADTSTTTSTTTGAAQMTPHAKPAAVGTVTAISGQTITLSDPRDNVTYTVDATNATIEKHTAPTTQGQAPAAPTTITVSGIAVGDTIMVRGTVSGTTITATAIDDGQMMGGRGHGGFGGPGIHGTVTAVNGTTLTVQDKDGKTYTVNADAARASKVQTISVSAVQVGDTIEANGTLSGPTLTAKHLMDGEMEGPDQASATATAQ